LKLLYKITAVLAAGKGIKQL